MNFSHYEQKVKEKIKLRVLKELLSFLKRKKINIWCAVGRKNLVYTFLVLALYKDLYGRGYTELTNDIHDWLMISSKTLRHNVKEIRKYGYKWARKQLEAGALSEWKSAVRRKKFKKPLKNVTLFLDSVDFPLRGKTSVSKKDPKWSFKCNAPGRRYMVVSDGRGKVRKMWGGYSPKKYDSDFMDVVHEELEDLFEGAEIVADQHFELAAKTFEKVKVWAKVKEAGKKRKRDHADTPYLSKENANLNAAIQHARGRVELPFAWMKNKFVALQNGFGDGEEQLDYLVWLAAALVTADRK